MPTSAKASTSAGISSRVAPKRSPTAPQAIAETSMRTGRAVTRRVHGGCSSSSSAPSERAMMHGSSGSQASAPSPPPAAASAATAALIRRAPRGA